MLGTIQAIVGLATASPTAIPLHAPKLRKIGLRLTKESDGKFHPSDAGGRRAAALAAACRCCQ